MGERIDAFAHWLPECTYEEILEARPTGALSDIGEPTKFWDVDRRLAVMDAFDVDAQVLTFTQHDWTNLGPSEALPILERAHDELRDLADEYPDRFIPVATLPYLEEPYLAEFERIITDLDVAGVQLFSNYGGRPLDSEAFVPFYELAAEHAVPIWIHPRTHNWYEWTREYSTHKMLGWPFETSLAMARLVFGGVFERFPDLDVVTHHAGGVVPFLSGRIRAYYDKEDRSDWVDLSRPVETYFSNFYADTMTNGNVPALDLGHEFYEPDRMVFATDYPFGPENGREYVATTVDAVERMDCTEADRRAIFGENATALLEG